MKYKAFISYRHAPLDSFVAQNLHKKLENFNVPRLANEETKKRQKGMQQRIFRDCEELPVSSNLTESITEALNESEFLIVVCTPRTPESKWVEKEIETFISLRGRDHILAVLVEGEPQDSFPHILQTATREIENLDHTITIEEYQVEPLAADIRGNNRREILKQLNREILRLEAPLIGCGFDDLRQRHKEQKMKRTLAIMGCAAVICGAFGSIALSQAIMIKNKSVELEKKNRQNLILQTKSLSDRALDEYQNGDRMTGALLALNALTSNSEDEPVAEAQHAMSKTLRVYDNGCTYEPNLVIDSKAVLEQMCFNTDGTKLVTIDDANQFCVWESATGSMLFETTDTTDCAKAGKIKILSNDLCIRCGTWGLIVHDLKTNEEQTLSTEVCYWCEISKDEQYMLVGGDEVLTVYDLSTMTPVKIIQREDDYSFLNGTSISETGKYIAYGKSYGAEDPDQEWKTCLGVMNLETGEEINIDLPYGWVVGSVVFDDGKSVAISKEFSKTGSYLAKGNESLICSDHEGNNLWRSDSVSEMKAHMQKTEDDKLYVYSGSDFIEIDMQTGAIHNQIGFSSRIVNFENMEPNGTVICYLEDGSVEQVNITEETMSQATMLDTKAFNVKAGTCFYNTICLMAADQTKAYLYTGNRSSNAEKIGDLTGYTSGIVLSPDETKAVAYCFAAKDLVMFTPGKESDGVTNITLPTDCVMEVRNIAGTNTFMVITMNECYQYSWEDGKLLATRQGEQYEAMLGYSFSNDDKYLYISEYEGVSTYETDGLKQIASVPQSSYLYQFFTDSQGKNIIGPGYQEQQGVMMNLADGSTTALEWLPRQIAYSKESKMYLVTDTLTSTLGIYKEDNTLVQSLPLPISEILHIGFDSKGTHFFVNYRDKSVEIYETKSISLVKTITGMNSEVDRLESVCDGKINVFYGNDTYSLTGYICNEEYSIVAEIPELATVTQDGRTAYASAAQEVLKYTILTDEELKEEAKKQLKGRELTQNERAKFYIE